VDNPASLWFKSTLSDAIGATSAGPRINELAAEARLEFLGMCALSKAENVHVSVIATE
jgi:hypothetical protein